MKSEMEQGLKDSDGDLVLETFRPYKISLYQESAIEAQENGELDQARELYQNALDEIDEYRDNITEIKEEATLSDEDRRHLANMESDLDQLESSLRQQLEMIRK